MNNNGSCNCYRSCVLSTYCVLGTAPGNSLHDPCNPWLRTSPLLDSLICSLWSLFSLDTNLCFCLQVLYCLFHLDISSCTYPHLTCVLHSRLYSDMTHTHTHTKMNQQCLPLNQLIYLPDRFHSHFKLNWLAWGDIYLY